MRSVTPRRSWDVVDSPAPCVYQRLRDWEGERDGGQRRPRAPMSSRAPRALEPKPASAATPADYDLRPAFAPGATIARAPRGALARAGATPGPGAYDPAPRAPRRRRLPTHEFLAAGDREIFPNARPLADGCGLAHGAWARARGFAPFGSKARHKSIFGPTRTPGPGAYDVAGERRFRTDPAPFGARGPREQATPADTPGPGAYRPESSRRAADDESTPFGQRSPRFEPLRPDNPNAPGQYEADVPEAVARLRTQDLPTPAFKFSSTRNPFPGNASGPGPGKYSPEVGARRSASRRLKCCIDGSTREKPGTFIGQYISDAPGPAAYSPEAPPPRRPGDAGGYVPHSPRSTMVRNTCAPSPERYSVGLNMLKPSLNVTYSVCKLG
jgi:hypothetical protein